jgi:hypothetical protein
MRLASMTMSALFSLLLSVEAAAQMTRPVSAATLTPVAAALHAGVPTPPYTWIGTVTAEAAVAPGAARPAVGDNKILLAAKARISAKQAAAKVKQRYGGKVLSIKLIDSKGPPVYRVKTLSTSGVVKVVFVDGQSGRVFE